MFYKTFVYSIFCFRVIATLILGGRYDTAVVAAETTEEYIEPEVHRYTNVLPREVCQKIIELGEAVGFPLEPDSIDEQQYDDSENNSSQAIDVVDEDGTVNSPDIFEQLVPFLPNIQNLIRSQRDEELDRILFPDQPPNRLPKLNWVFYRKYSPDSPRNSLIPHADSNMYTVNIALNDDFTGGGLFYVKPPLSINPDCCHPSEENGYYLGDEDPIPELLDHQYTYDYVNKLRRENTTDVVFPNMQTGNALIHNFTVWHAVAPIETGIRYSMVLFFDMHNPCLRRDEDEDEDEYQDRDDDDYREDGDDDNIDDGSRFNAWIRHEIAECDQDNGEIAYIPDNVDIFWVDPGPKEDEESLVLMRLALRPDGGRHGLNVMEGDIFQALRSIPDGEETPPLDSREVLASITIEAGKHNYKFQSLFKTKDDCDSYNSFDGTEL